MRKASRTKASGIVGLTCVAFLAAAPHLAAAQTGTTTLGVSASIDDSCTISVSPISFGDVNLLGGTNSVASGGLTVRCTNGTDWSATASAGKGSGATVATRKLTHAEDPTKTVNYMLFTDSGRTSAWGNGTGGSAISGTGTGSEQEKTIYAAIPSGQRAAMLGSYSDELTVTLTY